MWSAAMQINWNKRKYSQKKEFSHRITTNMAAISLFWYTNMAATGVMVSPEIFGGDVQVGVGMYRLLAKTLTQWRQKYVILPTCVQYLWPYQKFDTLIKTWHLNQNPVSDL